MPDGCSRYGGGGILGDSAGTHCWFSGGSHCGGPLGDSLQIYWGAHSRGALVPRTLQPWVTWGLGAGGSSTGVLSQRGWTSDSL